MPTKVGAVWCWAAVSPAVMLDKTPTRHDEVNINPLVYKLHNVAIRRHLDTKIALFVILMRTRQAVASRVPSRDPSIFLKCILLTCVLAVCGTLECLCRLRMKDVWVVLPLLGQTAGPLPDPDSGPELSPRSAEAAAVSAPGRMMESSELDMCFIPSPPLSQLGSFGPTCHTQ